MLTVKYSIKDLFKDQVIYLTFIIIIIILCFFMFVFIILINF